jgi:hypothetical protein
MPANDVADFMRRTPRSNVIDIPLDSKLTVPYYMIRDNGKKINMIHIT